MTKIILTTVTAFLISSQTVLAQTANPQQILNVNLRLENDNVKITSIDKTTGKVINNFSQDKNDYALQIVDSQNSSLFKINFSFQIDITGELYNEEGKMEGTYASQIAKTLTIKAPLLENSKKVQVLDNSDTVVDEKDLSTVITPPQPAGTQKSKSNLPFVTSIFVAIAAVISTFVLLRKKLFSAKTPDQNSQTTGTFVAITNLSPEHKSLSLALIAGVIVALIVFFFFDWQQKASVPAIPEPTPIIHPTTDETLRLLNILPIEVKGEYIFEYEPKSQFYSLDILNTDRQEEIKKEVVEIIKKVTEDGDYCKFQVLVAGEPEKVKVHKLPDC